VAMNVLVLVNIAKTHLLSRPKQTITAALGVTFGIGTFIILVSFMTGLNNLLDGLILNRTPHIHLYNQITPGEQQPVDLYDEVSNSFNVVHSIKPKLTQARIYNALPLLNFLANDQRVKGVSPLVKAQVFYVAGSIQLNGLINGVNILEEDRLFNLGDYIVKGSPQDLFRSTNGIIVGAGIAKKLSASLGDKIQVTSVTGDIFPLKIVGIYQSGLAEIDDIQSFANLKTTQTILNQGDNYITDLNVKLNDLQLAPSMAKSLAHQFNLTAVDINSANAQFETGTSIRNIITYAVSVALLIVAGFGIYNILNMLIYEKMNDIAILKATGFSGNDVRMVFMLQAMFIGLAGCVLGLVIGYVMSVVISHTPFETQALPTIKTFPVNFNGLFYAIGIVFALITTFFAGFIPANRARKIDPVEILRGQ